MAHAVDAPVGVAVLIADGYGEAAEVGAHQVDHLTLLAAEGQVGALARVRRPVAGTSCGQTRERVLVKK